MTEQRTELVPAESEKKAATRTRAPSTIRTVPDLYQVMVDQWGHRGEYTRGMIIRRDDLNPAHYDHEHALRVGAIRRLTEAEARPESWPLTTALDENGEVDENHRRAMMFHAGMTGELPRTVTTEQGPPEPAEFSKPTLPGPENNQPAARPIVTASALEAESEGTRATRIVATPAGPAFAGPEDQEPANGRRVSRSKNAEEG